MNSVRRRMADGRYPFFEDRAAPEGRAFEIASGSVRKLSARFISREASSRGWQESPHENPLIGAVSAYTVIVEAAGTDRDQSDINADYGATDVPSQRPRSERGVPRLTH